MIAIERARRSDAEAILAIQKRAFEEEARRVQTWDIPPLTESLASVIEQIDTVCVLKAVAAHGVVGSIRGVVTGSVCAIHRLSVDEAYRGQGLGSALLQAVEDAHPAAAGFELNTNAAMEGNVRFYVRHGYRVASRVQHGETITLAVMTKAREPSPSRPDPEEPMHPVDPVQRQLEAYNARNLERFVAQYAEDVRVFRPPAAEPVLVGKAAFARHYAEHRFTLPALHAEVVNRMVAGDIVVDHERISGLQPGVVEAIAVYAVADGLIHTVWFY